MKTTRDAVVAKRGMDSWAVLLGAWSNGLLGTDPRSMTAEQAVVAYDTLVSASFKTPRSVDSLDGI